MFNHWIVVAAIFGATGVVLGAFGAHALADRLEPARLASWHTAVQYHLLHAVALLALGLAYGHGTRRVGISAWSFSIGIALFSGSIYALVLTGSRWLGPITPIGGVCLIVGWIALLPLASARSLPQAEKSA